MSAEKVVASLSGLWQPHIQLKSLHYSSGCVEQHLLSTLPSPLSKVIIVTGTSLAAKTPLVHRLPIADVERALETVLSRDDVDTVLSLGGGSSIDTAKVISLWTKEKGGTFLTHLTIPTTLSAAKCTAGGGYTKPNGRPRWACQPFSTTTDNHSHDEDITTRARMLAAYASSGLKGENLKGVVRLKAHESPETAKQISRLLPLAGGRPTGDNLREALEVGDRVIALVDSPELDVGGLSARGVSKEEIPIIAPRALAGLVEGLLYDQLVTLV